MSTGVHDSCRDRDMGCPSRAGSVQRAVGIVKEEEPLIEGGYEKGENPVSSLLSLVSSLARRSTIIMRHKMGFRSRPGAGC
jgi:hypothetical protein